MKKIIPYKFQNWMMALLLIFVLSMIGLGISVFVGIFIPFWILLIFSLIYSIEKWFSYITRKHKFIGRLYRLFLNFSILSTLGVGIWSGIRLFSQQFIQSSVAGSLIFLAEIVFFIWMWKVVSKNSWRWPSMKLTILSLICLFVIFAFADVKPMSSIKDDAFARWDTYRATQKIKNEERTAQAERDRVLAEEEARKQAELEQEAAAKIEAENKAKEDQGNSEQDIITEENVETNGDSLVSKSIDVVDDLWDTSVDDYANKFNQYRQSKGLTPLEFTDDLNRVAELRLKELYTNFSHYSAGNFNEHLAENIAMSTGFLNNSDALVMWQNSPGHNANMLDRSYKYTGYAIGNGFAIQLFTEYTTINGKPQLPPGWYWAD